MKHEIAMKRNFIARFALLATGCAILFFSCKRDNNVAWDGELTSTIDNNFADSEFSAIRSMVDTEGRADSVVYGKVSGTQGIFCPGSTSTVTILSPTSAYLVLDFGTGSNCLDGRLRTGKLRATFNGKWKDAGSTVTITPENYTVAGYAFSFTAVVTFNGRDGNAHLNWTTVVTDAVMTHATYGVINWEGTRTTTWIAGEGNVDVSTYVYEVTGSANGTARNGRTFTANIDQPLRVELSCQWVVSGVWSIIPQGLDKRSIDYGTTGCDNQATFTVGTYTTTLTLP
jgi:hypothetical protein